VLNAARKIGEALRKKSGWHLVVLSSTVMPGATGSELLPVLEEASGKRCGEDFGLCYNPEFIALGSVIRDMLQPDMILIGESDRRSGDLLEKLYLGVCESPLRINRMSFVNAELTKIAVNTFVTTKISYANMLAQVCETLPGADVDVVTAAIGCDSRIGSKYLKGALGYGGPCFPRDNVAFAALARSNGAPALLAEATDQINRRQIPRLADAILARLKRGGTAGILGLSYKPDTEVVEQSQGVAVAKFLLEQGARVIVFDPEAMDNARSELSGAIFAESAADCVRHADVVAITTAWAQFKQLRPEDFRSGAAVLDCWRILDANRFEDSVEYFTMGLGPAQTAKAAAVTGD
ncbi:MAG: nucleotide sugar dehydrogenase, partial [Bryobacteraceae bacterium]